MGSPEGLLGLDCSKNKIPMALMGVVYNLTTVVCMGDTKKPSPGIDVGKKKTTEYSLIT